MDFSLSIKNQEFCQYWPQSEYLLSPSSGASVNTGLPHHSLFSGLRMTLLLITAFHCFFKNRNINFYFSIKCGEKKVIKRGTLFSYGPSNLLICITSLASEQKIDFETLALHFTHLILPFAHRFSTSYYPFSFFCSFPIIFILLTEASPLSLCSYTLSSFSFSSHFLIHSSSSRILYYLIYI